MVRSRCSTRTVTRSAFYQQLVVIDADGARVPARMAAVSGAFASS